MPPDSQRLIEIEVKTKALTDDMSDVKASLRDIAEAMKSLAVLEERHNNAYDAVKRAHTRSDDHERRIRKLELSTAANLWMERIVWIAVAFAINYWLSASVA